jgi:toxin ParE1/3/4
MRVDISPLAERDLEAIGDYIASDNPLRALSFVAELRTLCAKIAKAPRAYRARPELGKDIR